LKYFLLRKWGQLLFVLGVVDTKALTDFEEESLGCLGEKSILCGAGVWVGEMVWKYSIESVLQGVGRLGVAKWWSALFILSVLKRILNKYSF
jgi:hypothetical protein